MKTLLDCAVLILFLQNIFPKFQIKYQNIYVSYIVIFYLLSDFLHKFAWVLERSHCNLGII